MARARQFDEQLLLDCAQEAFWVSGYESTSIADISRVTGVGNGSIYAAYGSKLGLFLAVFSRYCDGRVELVRDVVSARSDSFEQAVAHYLDEIVADCTSHSDRRGCLMLNSVAALADRFPDVVRIADDAIERMEEIWVARIRDLRNTDEVSIADEQIPALAAHIVLVSQGLIQLSRTGAPIAKLRRISATSGSLAAARYAA